MTTQPCAAPFAPFPVVAPPLPAIPEKVSRFLRKSVRFRSSGRPCSAYGAALAEREPETALRQLISEGTEGARIVGSTMAASDPEGAANFFAGLHQASEVISGVRPA
jgi:hypothetical protein